MNDYEPSDEPLYNIGIVARMTGVPVATLRVWERRYGFPTPTRTAGGHRLCSERDVLRLRWVKARIDEGMQTGQAIRALQHMEKEGRLLESTSSSPNLSQPLVSDPSLLVFQERLLELLLANDLPHADQLLGEVLAIYPLEDLIYEVISPTLHEIGTVWEEGEISVGTEHLATNYLRQRLLFWMSSGPEPYSGVRPVLLACAPEEWHEGSLMMLGVLLRRRRWPVAYLGQATPLPDLDLLVHRLQPSMIVFVAMTEKSAAALVDWPQHLPDVAQSGRPIVTYGGRIFAEQSEWIGKVPGVYLGDTLRDGLNRVDHMLREINILPG